MLPRLIGMNRLQNYLQRNFEQIGSNRGIGAYRSYLQSVTNSSSSSLNELEMTRLTALGYNTGTLGDRWRQFLNAEGFGAFSIDDGARAYFSEGSSDLSFDSVTGTPIGLLLSLTHV